ncbi:MAG: DegV family protein [Bacillota bacterium]|nr:DegV family protein [Bacillota bacterium]
MKFILLSDSCADFGAEYYARHQIELVSLSYLLDGDEQADRGETAQIDAFYARLKAGEMSTTSAVNTQTFYQTFERLYERRLPIVCLLFSSALSATYSSGVAAREMFLEKHGDADIRVIDSLCASTGQGLLLDYARRLRDDGADADTVCDWLEENKLRLNHWFTVTSLTHLHKGGRVSAVSASIGNMLNIRPLFWMDEQGRLTLVDKEHGNKKIIAALLNKVAERCDTSVPYAEQTIAVNYGADIEDVLPLKKALKQQFGFKKIIVSRVGTVVGAHTGPGVFAVYFLGQKRE